MLEIRSLSVRYGHHLALDNVEVQVAPGETVAILGSNGAGKTTFINAIAGTLQHGVTGQMFWKGRDLKQAKSHAIVETGIAVAPEGRGIFGRLTVAENLSLGANPVRARGADMDARRAWVLETFPRLAERLDQRADTMSGGEQQMVAIGRSLMSNPDLLMLDEPSLGLSPIMTSELFKALASVKTQGTAILIVEQNARKTLALADRAYLLATGRIVGSGKANDVANDPSIAAAFLGGAPSSEQPQEAHERAITHEPIGGYTHAKL